MTPTTDTDELIETLERLEKEATPGPWKLFHDDDAPAVDYIERDMGDDRRAQGLEDPILHACLPREGDLPLIVSLRNHLPALISVLKENKRLRERAVSARASIMSAGVRIEHAGLRFDQVDGHKEGRSLLISAMEAATEAYETLGAALQPQGEK